MSPSSFLPGIAFSLRAGQIFGGRSFVGLELELPRTSCISGGPLK